MRYEAYVEKSTHIMEFIDKFRFNARRGILVQSCVKMVDRWIWKHMDFQLSCSGRLLPVELLFYYVLDRSHRGGHEKSKRTFSMKMLTLNKQTAILLVPTTSF